MGAEMNAELNVDNGADALAIAAGMQVTLNFAIALEDGSVVDGNFERAPASFRIGDGTMPEGFERCLLGLRAGDERRFRLAPSQGFGHGSPANVLTLPRQRFAAELSLEPGLVVDFTTAAGSLPGVVKAVAGDRVLVDFNHPLAGRTLIFAVAIRAVVRETGS